MFSYCSNFYIFWLMQWKTELFSVDFWPCYWKAKWNVLMFLHLEQFCTVRVVLTSHCMMKRSLYDINISYWDPPIIQLLNVLVCIEKRPLFVDHPYKRKESNSCLYMWGMEFQLIDLENSLKSLGLNIINRTLTMLTGREKHKQLWLINTPLSWAERSPAKRQQQCTARGDHIMSPFFDVQLCTQFALGNESKS